MVNHRQSSSHLEGSNNPNVHVQVVPPDFVHIQVVQQLKTAEEEGEAWPGFLPDLYFP